MGLCFGQDGEDEGSRLVGFEGGRHDEVFTRLQMEELHHLSSIHVALALGYGHVAAEERGRELPSLSYVLEAPIHISIV